jgi:hypothetical protein
MKLVIILWSNILFKVIICCPCGYFGKNCKYFYNNSIIEDYNEFPDYDFLNDHKYYLTYDNQIISNCKDGFTFNTFGDCVQDLCKNFNCPIGHCQMVNSEPKCFCEGKTVQINDKCSTNECGIQDHVDSFCVELQSVCIDEKNGKFRCECIDDRFSGMYCEKLTNKCRINTCQNGGTCVMITANSDCCMCLNDFTGNQFNDLFYFSVFLQLQKKGSRCEINLKTLAPSTNYVITSQAPSMTIPSSSTIMETSSMSIEAVTTSITSTLTTVKESDTSFSTENQEAQLSTGETTYTENQTTFDTTSYMMTLTQSSIETTLEDLSEQSTLSSRDSETTETITIYQNQSTTEMTNTMITLNKSRLSTTSILNVIDESTQSNSFDPSELLTTPLNPISKLETSESTAGTTISSSNNIKFNCTINPCKNGGKCELSSLNSFGYKCICSAYYSGTNCEMLEDDCSPKINPCQNNSTCTNYLGIGNYACDCKKNFYGKNCENQLNACTNNPCLNYGKCVDKKDFGKYKVSSVNRDFVCLCVQDFYGDYCETEKDLCQGEACLNGAMCKTFTDLKRDNQTSSTNSSNDSYYHYYTCSCTSFFYGEKCQFQSDELKLKTIISKTIGIASILSIIILYMFVICMDISKFVCRKNSNKQNIISKRINLKYINFKNF